MTAKKELSVKPRGRPIGSVADPATKKDRVNISILKKHQDIASKAGGGNVSAGVAVALDSWAKKNLK
jgi:hypothetical protein